MQVYPIYLTFQFLISLQVLPKDPFLHPYAFSLALTAYTQAVPPPSTSPIPHPPTTQPYALTSSNYIPSAPTPSNFLTSVASLAASHTYPIGIILTRELVECINNTYDLKIKHESHKVRRAIRNKRGTADSDGGVDSEQQRGRERINMNGGEGVPDGSPARGVGSSGGQILSGIGSLASGLRLGTGAVGDAGSIVNPTVDLTSFINGVIGSGSHIRRVKERKKESVDLVPMIGISVGKDKDGVVGGGLKLLWSGRVADIVRMREMDVDPPSGTGAGGSSVNVGSPERDKERPSDRWKKRSLPIHVASDGELDDLMGKEKTRKRFDGRSTEEESDGIPIIPEHSTSFGGMWGGRVRGKLGNWAGYVLLFPVLSF